MTLLSRLFGGGKRGELQRRLAAELQAAEHAQRGWARLIAKTALTREDPGALDLAAAQHGAHASQPHDLERALGHARAARATIDAARAAAARERPVALALLLLDHAGEVLRSLELGAESRGLELDLACHFARCGRCDLAGEHFERAVSDGFDTEHAGALEMRIARLLEEAVKRMLAGDGTRARELAVRVLDWARAFHREHEIDRSHAVIVSGLAIDGDVAALELRLADLAPGDPSEYAWACACAAAARAGDLAQTLDAARRAGDAEYREGTRVQVGLQAAAAGRDRIARALRAEIASAEERDEISVSLALVPAQLGEQGAPLDDLAAIADPARRAAVSQEIEALHALRAEVDAQLAASAEPLELPGAGDELASRAIARCRAHQLAQARALVARIPRGYERAWPNWLIVCELRRTGDDQTARAVAAEVAADMAFALARRNHGSDAFTFAACALSFGRDLAGMRMLATSVATDAERGGVLHAACWWAAFERDVAWLDELLELAQKPIERARAALGAADGCLFDESRGGDPWPSR